jgi:transposase InsO family protein
MLNKSELSAWYERLHISSLARSVIEQVRSSPPARQVGGGSRNVSGRYPSRKMGFTIQFESHRVELAGIFEMEHDHSVLEFYDQPPSIRLDCLSAAGRHLTVMHTPDFFLIRQDAAGWEEWKTEEELVRLEGKNPNRYRRAKDGQWQSSPGEEYAKALGLYYRVRSSQEIDWVFQRNILFLEDYLRTEGLGCDAQVRELTTTCVSKSPGISLEDLFGKIQSPASRDCIYSMIAQGELYVDLKAAPLVEPGRVWVYCDRQSGGDHVADVGGGPGSTVPGSMTCDLKVGDSFQQRFKEARQARLAAASDSDLRVANKRFSALESHAGGNGSQSVPPRTLRSWAARFREAKAAYGDGYLGLLPRIRDRGNRQARLPEPARVLMAEFIENNFETLKQKSRYSSWISLKHVCEQRGIVVPSYRAFRRAVRKRDRFSQTLKRKGRRAAYAYEPIFWDLELKTPRHGDRAFEIAHIDHTELDVEVRSLATGHALGRPWMTLLVDAFSRRILGLYLTFDPPSYRSCMMVLRDCVRRHGRFPQTVLVDGGAEFTSTYFETLLARYACTKKTRPPAKPRFGSVCERLFGTFVVDNKSAENALANGPEPWLRRWSYLFGALVIGQQCLEISAFELFPSINHHDLWKSLVSAHALTQDHHARTITGWIEGEIDRRHSPAVSVDQQGHPRAAQYPPRARTDDLHIQFGMVDMADFERPVSVPRCLQLKFEIKRLQTVSAAAALPFQPLTIRVSPTGGNRKSLITGRCYPLSLAGKLQLDPGRVKCLLLRRLIILFERFRHFVSRSLRQLGSAVAFRPVVRQQAQIPTSISHLCLAVPGNPTVKRAQRNLNHGRQRLFV